MSAPMRDDIGYIHRAYMKQNQEIGLLIPRILDCRDPAGLNE